MGKLSGRELDCAEVLVGKGKSVRSVARDLQVDETGGPHVPDSPAWFLECAHELRGALSGAVR